MRRWGWLGVDVALVATFVAVGRSAHHVGGGAAGFATVGWPFLTALALSWVPAWVRVRPARLVPAGVSVWLVTALGGLALRALAGQTVPWVFVLVATGFLGVFLLGWRVVIAVLAAVRGPDTPLTGAGAAAKVGHPRPSGDIP